MVRLGPAMLWMPGAGAVLSAAAGDVLWCVWALRRCGRWRGAGAWRAAVVIFTLGQFALLAVAGGYVVDEPHPRLGLAALASVLWHAVVLPATLLCVGLGAMAGAAWRRLRRSRSA